MAITHPRYFALSRQTYAWTDIVNLLLGIWLFISPWVLQFAAASGTGSQFDNAAWNAWVLGVIVFIVAAVALSAYARAPEWLNLLLGIWIFIAPWVLGFALVGSSAAAWDHWVVGALVFIFAGTRLSGMQRIGSTAPNRPDAR